MTDRIDRLVAGIAPDPGPGLTPLALELLDEITRAPAAAAAPPPRRRRRWLAVPVVAGIAAVALVLSWIAPGVLGLGPAPAAAALRIERDGADYVITVRDVFADPQRYERELRARNLNIELQVLPTSRSRAGAVYIIQDLDRLLAEGRAPAEGRITVIDGPLLGEEASPDGPVAALTPPGSCAAPTGCPLGVRVPVDLTERARITIGREARPGESYGIRPDADAEGEPLHCVAYVNRTVAEVTRTAREHRVEPSFAYAGATYRPDRAPAAWYVHEGVMSSATTAIFLIDPDPAPSPRTVPAGCGGS